MFSTVHAATGAALGSLIPNAPLAFGAGVVSHFLLDRIPHNDPDFPKGQTPHELIFHPMARRFFVVAIVDITITAALILWLVRALPAFPATSLISGTLGGVVPDFLFALSFLINHPWARWYNRFHEQNHFNEKKYPVSLVTGSVIQVIIFSISIGVLFR